jgi:hypothetical protein
MRGVLSIAAGVLLAAVVMGLFGMALKWLTALFSHGVPQG